MGSVARHWVPRGFQPLCMEFIQERSRPGCALWAPPGMGKSSTTLTSVDTFYLSGAMSRPTLVLGPLRVAREVWSDEAAKWKHLSNIVVSPIVGTEQERIYALRKDASVYTCNYEQIPWLLDRLRSRWPFGMVVADESTKLKGFRLQQGTQRSHILSEVRAITERWLNLTGTPSPNGLQDLWGQTWFLDRGKRLGLSYTAFLNRFFYTPPTKHKNDKRPKIKAFDYSNKQIQDLLRDICMSLDPKDWFDLQEPVPTIVKVKLPAAARKIYDVFERTMFAELADGTDLEVFNAAALTNKCLQIANGAAYQGKAAGAAEVEDVDKIAYKVIHDAKLEALESIASESSVPLLVAYNFRSDKERILKAFPHAVFLGDKKGMAKFKAGDAPMGVGHDASIGHGVDGLQDVTNVLVRFGHSWNLENRMQMFDRIGPVRQAQSGHIRPVLTYDLVAEDTLDEVVLARHDSKREVQDLLMDAMKMGATPQLEDLLA